MKNKTTTWEMALEMVSRYGIDRLDNIQDTTIRNLILRGFGAQLGEAVGIQTRSAMVHIRRAVACLHDPENFELPKHGGKRDWDRSTLLRDDGGKFLPKSISDTSD